MTTRVIDDDADVLDARAADDRRRIRPAQVERSPSTRARERAGPRPAAGRRGRCRARDGASQRVRRARRRRPHSAGRRPHPPGHRPGTHHRDPARRRRTRLPAPPHPRRPQPRDGGVRRQLAARCRAGPSPSTASASGASAVRPSGSATSSGRFWRGARRSLGCRAASGQSGRRPAKVLFIDNYDSFVYNLVQYVGELGATAEVVRNDAVTVDELVAARERGDFTHLIVSPGPGTPADAGISIEAIRRLGPTTPTLGVCLGHQAIGEVYGATVVRAPEIVHGKPSLVHHDGLGRLRRTADAAGLRALSLARHRPGDVARRARGDGAHGFRHPHGRPASHASGRRRADAPRVDPHGARPRDAPVVPAAGP